MHTNYKEVVSNLNTSNVNVNLSEIAAIASLTHLNTSNVNVNRYWCKES